MFSLKKRYVVVLGILGGLGIANQDFLKSSWARLQSMNAQESWAMPSDRDLQQPFLPEGSVTNSYRSHPAQASLAQPDRYTSANTSFDGGSAFHLPSTSGATKFSSASEGSSARMVSATNRNESSRASADLLKIRIATFNMNAFGESKLQKSAVVESIAMLIRKFDVVAVQHIQSRQQNILPEFIDKVNVSDRRYEYCIGPRVGPEGNQQQFAFIFDSDRIETDRHMLYTVEDPQQILTFEPLVGWFRAKTVRASEAFTFSLVNIRIDPLQEARERQALPDLLRSVRQDGRLEDDIILAGDFGCSEKELGALRRSGVVFALEGTPTTVTGEAMLDNIIFPARATDEFTGRAGVVDFLRQNNLSIDQAFQISTHMPVWAEFTATEGGLSVE
jgi:endonuclease/exonuclease/phosphatase family metal-dependent hydrolase